MLSIEIGGVEAIEELNYFTDRSTCINALLSIQSMKLFTRILILDVSLQYPAMYISTFAYFQVTS